MAERITPQPYWHYDTDSPDGEEGVIIATPCRSNRDGPYDDWSYAYTPKIGEKVLVTANRDSDQELVIVIPGKPDLGDFYIWEQCVQPAVLPVPEDIDLTKPTDIEKWLEEP